MAMRYEEPAIRNSRAYRLAFEQYLRYGTAIRLEEKAEEHSTTHYIWRTQGDDRVRPSHRANNGSIYAFNNPPATGNPGEAYGSSSIDTSEETESHWRYAKRDICPKLSIGFGRRLSTIQSVYLVRSPMLHVLRERGISATNSTATTKCNRLFSALEPRQSVERSMEAVAKKPICSNFEAPSRLNWLMFFAIHMMPEAIMNC